MIRFGFGRFMLLAVLFLGSTGLAFLSGFNLGFDQGKGESRGRVMIAEYKHTKERRLEEISWIRGDYKEIWFEGDHRAEVDVDEDVTFELKPGEAVASYGTGYRLLKWDDWKSTLNDEDLKADQREGEQK